jgi:hypothetical protein
MVNTSKWASFEVSIIYVANDCPATILSTDQQQFFQFPDKKKSKLEAPSFFLQNKNCLNFLSAI